MWYFSPFFGKQKIWLSKDLSSMEHSWSPRGVLRGSGATPKYCQLLSPLQFFEAQHNILSEKSSREKTVPIIISSKEHQFLLLSHQTSNANISCMGVTMFYQGIFEVHVSCIFYFFNPFDGF